MHTYKYIYRNPIEAGLVKNAEDYYFSTLHSKIGQSKALIPIVEDTILFPDIDHTLNWLNKEYPSPLIKEEIRKSLRRREFRFSKDKNKKKSDLENQLV